MSFDIQFFCLSEGETLANVNEYLESDEYLAAVEAEESEEDDEFLLARFVDSKVSREELEYLIGKAYLRATVPAEKRSKELNTFLESDKRTTPPDEFAEDLGDLFEWAGPEGTLPMCFSYGGDLQQTVNVLGDILEELAPKRVVIFDPQSGKAIGGANAREMLAASGEESEGFAADVISSIMDQSSAQMMESETQEKIMALLQKAEEQEENEDYDAQIISYQQAWDLIPEPKHEYVGAYMVKKCMAAPYFQLGDYRHALECCEEAGKCFGVESDAHYFIVLGKIHLVLGHEAAATKAFSAAYDLEGKAAFEASPYLLRWVAEYKASQKRRK